ncbi:CoA ester lyase [Variovorax sp. J22R24]|uniref:HpcH/HpaI aldolase/citrate lyase family protein n=1 Tax=Variovorax gracilis TaxID=3053502 RepID=UPI002578755C|nr:CoA ester lyase [Variovorax sp. J22R24]MDM0107667.1 CoA ester lyase [Variovorax sp. J22R24]
MIERSYLFVPGDRPERIDKALASGAHAVIVDLEDAVQPDHKDAARAATRAWLEASSRPVILRINPPGTPWNEHDCELLALRAVRAVMLPKAEDAGQLHELAGRLREDQMLLPLVETVAGHFAAVELARVRRVQRLAFGSFDFMADAGIRGDAEELDAIRTQLVLVSRMAGLQAPVDGVTLGTDDAAQIAHDVQRSRRYGMGAKLCIHPRQVSAVNSGFAPSDREIDWARRVVAALAHGHGAVTVDGKLVDRPIELQARAILAEAPAAGASPLHARDAQGLSS